MMGTLLGKEVYRKHKHAFYTKYSTNVKLSVLCAARQVTIHTHTRARAHTNNCVMIWYSDIQTSGKPSTCFCLFRPSSGRYSI